MCNIHVLCFVISAVKRRVKGPPAAGLAAVHQHRQHLHCATTDEEWMPTDDEEWLPTDDEERMPLKRK